MRNADGVRSRLDHHALVGVFCAISGAGQLTLPLGRVARNERGGRCCSKLDQSFREKALPSPRLDPPRWEGEVTFHTPHLHSVVPLLDVIFGDAKTVEVVERQVDPVALGVLCDVT